MSAIAEMNEPIAAEEVAAAADAMIALWESVGLPWPGEHISWLQLAGAALRAARAAKKQVATNDCPVRIQ